MTRKEQRFVAEYLADRNAVAAACRAGYSRKAAKQSAVHLMKRPAIVEAIEKHDYDRKMAKGRACIALDPISQAALTTASYAGSIARGHVEFGELTKELQTLSGEIGDRHLGRVEQMLIVQAHTLDGLYNKLVRDALATTSIDQLETMLKLALRAQSQCRATLETISVIQNPPIAGFINQANISRGHQQVNNSLRGRARDENPPTKLLERSEHEPDEWLDQRAPQAPGAARSQLEAVGNIDGTEDAKRQG